MMVCFIASHFWKSFFMQVVRGVVCYDKCDVEYYYTIEDLISLHISRKTILLTLLKLFLVVFYV